MKYQVWYTTQDGTVLAMETDNPNQAAVKLRQILDVVKPVTAYVRDTSQALASIGAADRGRVTAAGRVALRG